MTKLNTSTTHSEKRKRISLAIRPDLHERLRLLASKKNMSMSRYIESLIIVLPL